MRVTPSARMASSSSEVATAFCSRSRRGCSKPWRTSALACRWKTTSQPSRASRSQAAVEHVARDHLALRVGAHAGDVLAPPGGEVVVDHHGDAVGEQAVGQVGADEAGPARDQGASHRAVPNRLSPPLW